MASFFSLTTEDLQNAVWRGVRFPDIEGAVLKKLKIPYPRETCVSPLFLLHRTSPQLAEIVSRWMQGPADKAPVKAPRCKNLIFIPYVPRGIDLKRYLLPLIQKHKPAAISVNASPGSIGAALHYAFSLLYALKIPVRAWLCDEDICYEEAFFQSGDFLPELAALCFRKKLPLIPLSVRPRLVPSQLQLTYGEFIGTACKQFAHETHAKIPLNALEKRGVKIMNSVFAAGFDFLMERENLITESCYAASRLLDLCRCPELKKGKGASLLVLYPLPHVLDFPQMAKLLLEKEAIHRELYRTPEPQTDGCLQMAPQDTCQMPYRDLPADGLFVEMEKIVHALLKQRMDERISLEQIDNYASAVAEATRHHPLISRPSGVRGTLAIREIAQAYGLIRGTITCQTVADAAAIALTHRNHIKPGEDKPVEEVLKSIISRVVCRIPLYSEDQERSPGPAKPLSPEALARALMGLADAAFRQLEPGEPLPIDNPAFAEEALNHPLVQQALKDAMEKGLLKNMQQGYQELLKELEDRGYLDLLNSSQMTLSDLGQKQLQKSLEEALARGEITPEELANALNNARSLPKPPGAKGKRLSVPPRALGEMLAELMDFQHQGRSQSSSIEDLYVHYTLSEKKGLEIAGEKVDYEKLKILLHDLEKKGMVTLSEGGKRFSLSCLALGKLLEKLVERKEGQALQQRAFKQEHELDKNDVRRYRTGDVFRDISVRHSLRRVSRKGKSLEEVNRSDLRSFEKKPSRQLDIAICVDVSASMKEQAKLRYAKMAIAELAKAALEKHDRVGVVSFSNLGQIVVPLTDKLSSILEATMSMKAEQYTNIGNGLICARRMLLKEKNSNPKYILLITDGQPNAALIADQDSAFQQSRVAAYSRETSMERKELIGIQHALNEAAKTRRADIKISVVFISEQEAPGEKLAREVARIGHGRFHKVHAVERLPLEALATVA